MLTETTLIDRIEVLENGTIQVREVTRILRDDEVIASSFHRATLTPGDDLSTQDPKVKDIAKAAWKHLKV